MIAASWAPIEMCGRSSPEPAPAAGTPPKPAKRMLATERFIAVAISIVRIVPEEPTRVPATISATLSSAKPAAAAERPVNAFSSEITTGMSAPPIGSTTRLPSSAAAISTPMNRPCEGSSLLATCQTQAITTPARSSALTTCCPGTASGRVGIRSWSLAKAMFEPQKEIEPTTAENRIGISSSSGISALGPKKSTVSIPWRNSDHAISATAPPPTPL